VFRDASYDGKGLIIQPLLLNSNGSRRFVSVACGQIYHALRDADSASRYLIVTLDDCAMSDAQMPCLRYSKILRYVMDGESSLAGGTKYWVNISVWEGGK
jgi:hypothetical protein